MADITINKNVLKIVASFADDDDRTLTVDNPAASITAGDSISSAAIQDLSNFIRQNQIIIGDKNSADFTRIKSAKVINGTTTYFDLT